MICARNGISQISAGDNWFWCLCASFFLLSFSRSIPWWCFMYFWRAYFPSRLGIHSLKICLIHLKSATIMVISRFIHLSRNCNVFFCSSLDFEPNMYTFATSSLIDWQNRRTRCNAFNNGIESSNWQLILTQHQCIQRWQPLRRVHGICMSNWSVYHGRFARCPRIAQPQYWSSYRRTVCRWSNNEKPQ